MPAVLGGAGVAGPADTDPLGADAIRHQVLATWCGAPDRFREDANAEEDLALGGYRDRAVVELAQNAADAAVRAGVPGRLLLRLAQADGGHVLVAANTGAALDAAGVRALASLRASAKHGQPHGVGRFGVGFAAVLALTDAPVVCSRGAGVRFSRADSAALVGQVAAGVPALARELERRDGHVPVLRLPFPAEGTAPEGYDTVVLAPLRDPALDSGAALDLCERLLDTVDDTLLLALPGLDEVVVARPGAPDRRLGEVEARWLTHRARGRHADADLADRPTEERRRADWSLTWAVPRDRAAGVPSVLYAPTPTDEPMSWPALLIAPFPLDPTRRHVAPGPARDALVAQAARAFAEMLARLAGEGQDVLPLVPTGLPAGPLDADLRAAVLPLLAAAPVLRLAGGGGTVRPRDAVALASGGGDPDVLAALAPVVPALVAAPRSATAALAGLGVIRVSLAEVVETLPAHPDPAWYAPLYARLLPLAADPRDREALGWLPVPLADGRVVRGVRGVLLGEPGLGAAALEVLATHGLRVAHPAAVGEPAAARLLERLGAVVASARTVLDDPAVRAAVAEAADQVDERAGAADVAPVVDAVLTLVAAAVESGSLRAGELPWLGDLPLTDADGEPTPAAGLVLAGSPAQQLLDPGEVGQLAADVAGRWPAAALEAVGVARSLALVRLGELDTGDLPDELADLDGAQEWLAGLPAGVTGEVVAVRDLDLVLPQRRDAALALVAGEADLLAALREPVQVTGPDGRSTRARSYPAWWWRRRLGLAARVDEGADPALAALLAPAPASVRALPAPARRALGLVRDWADLDADGWAALLSAAGPGTPVPALLRLWAALGAAAERGDLDDVPAPARLAALTPQGIQAVAAAQVAVVDAPMWAQRGDLGGLIVLAPAAAVALADALDLALASECAPGEVEAPAGPRTAGAVQHPVPVPVLDVLGPQVPRSWWEHETLRVDGVDLGWWVAGQGQTAVVRATTLSGLARGLAQAAGAWPRRWVVEALLSDPGSATTVQAEAAMDSPA